MSSRWSRSPERKRLAIEGRESRRAKDEKEERGLISTAALEEEIAEKRQRKRKSRWDAGSYVGELAVGGQLPTSVNIEELKDKKQQEIFLLQLKIRELTGRLGLHNLGIPSDPKDRSPSPEPIYNEKGVRVNTRLERTRTKLIAERTNTITRLRGLDPTYFPPACMNYRCPELEDRVDVPQALFPELNFLGLILGPRGSCLEKLRKDTRCNIILKGKGTKHNQDSEDEPMHLTISGETREGVKKAGDFLRQLIKDYANDPNGPKMLALRAQRKHEMQVLNGTLREFDTRCQNCAATTHKTWECPEGKNIIPDIVCENCGNAGHPTFDCKVGKEDLASEAAAKAATGNPQAAMMDQEYAAFLHDMKGGVSQHWTQQQWQTCNQQMAASYGMPSMAANATVNLLGAKKEAAKLMLTHDQQQPTATDSSQNAYEQYIQNYAAQQAYAQQAYAVYEASFTRNRTYVPREPKKCVRSDGPSKCPYHGRAPPYGDPFAGNKMLPGETEAMWKKWYEAQGYDTTNWWGCCPGSEGPSPPLPDKPPTDPQDRALQSIFFPDKEKSQEKEEQKAIAQEKKEESLVNEEHTSVLDGMARVLKEEEGSSMKEEKTGVKLKLDFASLPPPPPPPPPAQPE